MDLLYTNPVVPKLFRRLPVMLLWLMACSRQVSSPLQTPIPPSQQPSPERTPTPTVRVVAQASATAVPSAIPGLTATEEPISCQPLIEIPPGFGEWAQITSENVSRLEQWMSLDLPGAEFRFSSNLSYLAILLDRQVQIYDIVQSRLIRCLPRDETIDKYEFQFTFSADEKYFVWTPHKGRIELQIEVQEVIQAQALGSMAVAEMCCEWVYLSPDGRYVAINAHWDSEQILLWDVVVDEVFPLDGRGLVFSPDGHLAAVSNYFENEQLHQVSLWDLSTRQIIYSEKPAFGPMFSPDGTELSYHRWIEQPEVLVIDLKTLEQTLSLTGFDTAAPIFFVTFAPDRQTLVWEARGIQLMNVVTGQLGPKLPYQLLAFSPDSHLLAVADAGYSASDQRGVIWLLDVQSGEEKFSFDLGDDRLVRPLAFSADSQMLATLDQDDNLIRFWSLSTGAELYTLIGSAGPIYEFEYALSGRALIVRMASGTVVLWAIPNE